MVASEFQFTIKIFTDEICRSARNIDVFAHQIAVDAGNKILCVEINIFDF